MDFSKIFQGEIFDRYRFYFFAKSLHIGGISSYYTIFFVGSIFWVKFIVESKFSFPKSAHSH